MSGSSPFLTRVLNPSRLHLQKLSLELKCPICLNLLNQPILLPCNHILCSACIPKSSQSGSECQLCERHYADQDVRPAPYMENMVTIFRSLDATLRTDLLQSHTPDAVKVQQGSSVSLKVSVDNELKEPAGSPPEGSSSNGQSTNLQAGKKRVRALLDCSPDKENKLIRGSGNPVPVSRSEDSSQDLEREKKSDDKLAVGGGAEAPKTSDVFDTNRSTCVFCQSSEITDRTGLMLHYLHGKEVVGDAAMSPNAIHVHKTCLEWTPQAYFEGNTVKNLENEIARGAKLKCSHCGIKGAALGCFSKMCRRTYHVPCAVGISDCRWEMEQFLLLCPTHRNGKFPGEKSKLGRRTREKQQFMPAAITSRKLIPVGVPSSDKKLLFCGSALSSEEKYELVKFASTCGALVTKFWNPDVTHVIASTDSNGTYVRTLKVLKAILHGRWILKTDWVRASMAAMHPVDEEPYEVCQDKNGCCDGPKKGRLRAMENAPKPFDGLYFYFFGDFVPGYKDDLLDLVVTAGGTILKSKEDLIAQKHITQSTPSTSVVVYNSDLTLEEEDPKKEKIDAAISFAKGVGCNFIGHTWLLESIASCMVMPF